MRLKQQGRLMKKNNSCNTMKTVNDLNSLKLRYTKFFMIFALIVF